MSRRLTDAEFGELLATFERSALRLELQRQYSEPTERETVAKFLAGSPEPPTAVEDLRSWFDQIARLTRTGKRIERVRVHDNPPSDYQRWERWIGSWNIRAGETLRYMTRERAHEVGLLPAAGERDWWLLDDARLIVMAFDNAGHRTLNELVTDPEVVAQARTWWDLAVRYSVPDKPRDIAA
jgi:hypothetical protein